MYSFRIQRQLFKLVPRTVYILQCNDADYYYIGITTNLERRLKEHQTGEGSAVFVKQHGGMFRLLNVYPAANEAIAKRLERSLTLEMVALYGSEYVAGANLYPWGTY